MNYPTTFAESIQPLPVNNDATQLLAERGFVVTTGMHESDVPKLSSIANSPQVVEYCANDSGRFGNVEKWLSKERGFFPLRDIGSNALAGYGWTGPATCEEVPDGDTTFALRIAPEFSGRGLAAPFTAAILAGTTALYGDRRVWLETWGSNTAAVRTYLRNGAELVTTKDAYRPTLMPADNEPDGKRRDVRLYMRFPET